MPIQVKKKCGVYFISDTNGIKIGFSDDIDQRLGDLQTGNSQLLTHLTYIPTPKEKLLLEENKAQQYFKDSHMQGEWYSISEEEAYGYVEEREGVIINEAVKKESRTPTIISTLFGPQNGRSLVPPCYFYPDEMAHAKNAAGVSNNHYRKIPYQREGKNVPENHPSYAGKTVIRGVVVSLIYVSGKWHKERLNVRHSSK